MGSDWCTEKEPVYYCTKCLSLNIQKSYYISKGVQKEGSVCRCCGNYNIRSLPFYKWVALAEEKGIKVERPAKWAIKLSQITK